MELRHLRYFTTVAEERHFGRAAARLRIAQPPLSRQIHALEAELGFSLFDRTSRRVELTSAGAVFLHHTKKVFEALDRGVHEAKRAGLGETGRLVVGYLSSLAYSGVIELLRAFRAAYPLVDLSLRELAPQTQIDALKAGEVDIGFIRAPLEEPSLAATCVRREPLVIALPSDHRLAKRKRLGLEAVASEPFVFFPRSRSQAFFDRLMRLCHDAGFVPRIVQEAPQLDIASLVAAGFGVSILPLSFKSVGRTGIVFVPIAGCPTADLLLTWRKGETSAAVTAFIQFVRKVGVDVVPE